MVIYHSQAELDEAVAYWQVVLGLRDWRIKATLSYRHEFDDEYQQGLCKVTEISRDARIWILRHEDYPADATYPQDQETTLVHELVHVHIHPLEPEDYDERLEIAKEQAVNALSDGFVRLKRGLS